MTRRKTEQIKIRSNNIQNPCQHKSKKESKGDREYKIEIKTRLAVLDLLADDVLSGYSG